MDKGASLGIRPAHPRQACQSLWQWLVAYGPADPHGSSAPGSVRFRTHFDCTDCDPDLSGHSRRDCRSLNRWEAAARLPASNGVGQSVVRVFRASHLFRDTIPGAWDSGALGLPPGPCPQRKIVNKLNPLSLYRVLTTRGPLRAEVAGYLRFGWRAFSRRMDRDERLVCAARQPRFLLLLGGGQARSNGHAAAAYGLELIACGRTSLDRNDFKIAFPYPPHALLFAAPLSLFHSSWHSGCGKYSRRDLLLGGQTVFAVAFSGGVGPAHAGRADQLSFGQVGLFFGSLWLFAFRGSWFAAAALTFKPHLGLLVAVEDVSPKQVAKAALVAAALVLLSVIFFGISAWDASLFGAAFKQIGMLSGGNTGRWYSQMTTPLLSYGIIGWSICAVSAAWLLRRNFNVFTAATASFLISPYGFHYDMAVSASDLACCCFNASRR